jgi:hypothetical protein
LLRTRTPEGGFSRIVNGIEAMWETTSSVLEIYEDDKVEAFYEVTLADDIPSASGSNK